MLEIVWRNPNRLVLNQSVRSKDLASRPVTGQPPAIFCMKAAPGNPEVKYELVVSRRKAACVPRGASAVFPWLDSM